MKTYESGGHAYHATMPTDAIKHFRDTINETADFGFDNACKKQQELGDKVRLLLKKYNIKSVAADGYHAPGVVVSYTTDKEIHNGSKFKDIGMQIAAGVPLQCDEGEDYQTFRLGLFGLDKLKDIDSAANYTFIKGNICDAVLVMSIFEDYKIDGVIHLAAESHVDRSIKDPFAFIQTNILGTVNLLNAAKQTWQKNYEGKLF